MGGANDGFLRDLDLSVSVQNLFDRNPPFYVNSALTYGYDAEQANPLGRVVSLSIRKKW